MKLKLHTAAGITSQSIKKIQSCLLKNTVVIITASWCAHCITFAPEKKKFIETVDKHNIIDINDVALNELKSRDYSVWKSLVPDDHRVYFPMILIMVINRELGRVNKKIYNGSRTNREIKEYVKKII